MNNKLPLLDRRISIDKGNDSFERQSFADLKSTLGDLFDLVTVVKDRLHGIDKRLVVNTEKIDSNSESIVVLQKKIIETIELKKHEVGFISMPSSSTPISALTEEDHQLDKTWREAELNKDLSDRLTDPEIMICIAEKCGADFLMMIRWKYICLVILFNFLLLGTCYITQCLILTATLLKQTKIKLTGFCTIFKRNVVLVC